ncbi:hypothetical protein D3C86_1905310 [compost metagenome]
MFLHVGNVIVETMLDLRHLHHLTHLVVQLIRDDPQYIAQGRSEDFERRGQHAQGQQNQDHRVDIHRPLVVTLSLEQQRDEETHQQSRRQHRVHQPTDVVELDQR